MGIQGSALKYGSNPKNNIGIYVLKYGVTIVSNLYEKNVKF